MPFTTAYPQRTRYRITLEVDVLDDFDPKNIDWENVLDIQTGESVDVYVENMSDPVEW